MKKSSKKSKPKKIGRPKSTGAGTPMVVRMHKPQLKAIDQWIANTGLTRPEAIRQLVDWALEHVKPKEMPEPPPLNLVRRARDQELRNR